MTTLNAMAPGQTDIAPEVMAHSSEAIRHHSSAMSALFPAGAFALPRELLPAIDERRGWRHSRHRRKLIPFQSDWVIRAEPVSTATTRFVLSAKKR